MSVGLALAERMNGSGARVYVVMGDGELAEGSVWEGAMAGGHYKLSNLCAVVDRNRLQISGGTEEVMAQDSQDARWSAFGWNVLHAEGNHVEALDEAFGAVQGLQRETDGCHCGHHQGLWRLLYGKPGCMAP